MQVRTDKKQVSNTNQLINAVNLCTLYCLHTQPEQVTEYIKTEMDLLSSLLAGNATPFPEDDLAEYPGGLNNETVLANSRAWCQARSSGVCFCFFPWRHLTCYMLQQCACAGDANSRAWCQGAQLRPGKC
jgi:hypothetical protein